MSKKRVRKIIKKLRKKVLEKKEITYMKTPVDMSSETVVRTLEFRSRKSVMHFFEILSLSMELFMEDKVLSKKDSKNLVFHAIDIIWEDIPTKPIKVPIGDL